MKKAKSVKAAKKPVKKAAKPAPKKSKPAKKVAKPAPKKAKPVKKVVKAVKKSVKKAKPVKAIKKVAKPTKVKEIAKPKKEIKKPAAKPATPIINKITPVKPKMKEMPKGKAQVDAKANERSRYSDEDLKEFKGLILNKLEDARKELINLQAALVNANEHGTDDTASSFKMLEDGSETLAKEEAGQLAARQRKFVDQLENALVRIENKTYGICRVTGKLIPKERLRAVPHTTQSIEAKLNQYRD